MVSLKMQDAHVFDSENNIIAKVMKASNSGNEVGKTFALELNGELAALGIKKGRLFLADYRFQMNGEE
ncbi:hypothetical protein [Brevibacillus fortis]|uniref:Uncharacterized protein n=1 Tax=Brevibacillus fortis TaxID=2126352 RepID=A0A2P7V8G5_9BACL|nr:hypothetical protein [Brevibacillus fortis]PSJ95500.1 hypothetical protein C7R93_12235 [Brevibacillus fortis]